MVATSARNWLIADERPWVLGSKNVANPSPMVKLEISPAISTAANTMRMLNPIASPTSISCARISSPAKDIGSAAGSAGTVGATIIASITPSMTLTVAGTALLPNNGAAASRPRMRVSGHNSPAIHRLISALERVIMRVCYPPLHFSVELIAFSQPSWGCRQTLRAYSRA